MNRGAAMAITTADTGSSSSNKKQRRCAVTAAAADVSLLHQTSSLHFGYNYNNYCSINSSRTKSETTKATVTSGAGAWICHGKSVLYVIAAAAPAVENDSSNDDGLSGGGGGGAPQQLAFHLRGSCAVDSVQVETTATTATAAGLAPVPCAFYHVDPLQHVLVRSSSCISGPSSSSDNVDKASTDEHSRQFLFDADAQSSRGAAGMTVSLRAASVASNLGELRVVLLEAAAAATTTPVAVADSSNVPKKDENYWKACWRSDLEDTVNCINGQVGGRLQEQLRERSEARRRKRLALVADRLAENGGAAFKVTILYRVLFSEHFQSDQHLAGIHAAAAGSSSTPHVYTTCGAFGDHEGPRSWLPSLDSAAANHRATHSLSVTVTAPAPCGLSVAGCGEDFGAAETVLHQATGNNDDCDGDDWTALKELVGADHVDWIVARQQQEQSRTSTSAITTSSGLGAHVIPSDQEHVVSLAAILATVVWCSHTWTPVPCRSLGFAIGPFKVLEDPEYFGPSALLDEQEDDDDEDDESFEDRLAAFLEGARKYGEGIRQVYFAPLFERKHIHTSGSPNVVINTSLLPNMTLQLLSLTAQQKETARQLDLTVTRATTGIPHRALSLMRDVLALPCYRTASYTQIWIPNAVQGGSTSGALHNCPEVLVNPFLGGAIMDSRLQPPVGSRLPFYQGGRVLQFLQARCAVRGWITAALPIGGRDDVGTGYIFALVESFIMSLYERGHGGQGEGGSKGGIFFSKRYSVNSGLNSANLDFLPVQNIEEIDEVIGVGAVPVEDRHNEQLWRGANNGSESHTSAMDEFNARQLLAKDGVEALERGTDKDKAVPSPSLGWFGSYLSLSFLSSNATSSTDLGCGAVELLHPIGGLVYRALKSEVFRGVVEGRASVANFIRLIRAAFIAAHLDDVGEKELKLPKRRKRADTVEDLKTADTTEKEKNTEPSAPPKQPFVICVNEILSKKGLTHTLFTRALQNLSGRIKEPQLLGTLVDAERMSVDPRTGQPFVEPEGFPNSYVRGASLLLCRVGVQVETTRDSTAQGGASVAKGVQMQAYAEPVIPEGGIAYGGPITVRVVENEGSFREYVKDLATDGSRRDWGATFLHAKPVTTAKAQTAASGDVETKAASSKGAHTAKTSTMDAPGTTGAFTESNFHAGGYQAIELIRLTNLTPLLWVRVDPMGLYGGRISVFQPDACLAEQLFHDGDAAAQIDAIRVLAERPLKIQGSVKVTTVYDVSVSELPVRVLGDCLRGSPALHSSLPHTPVVRAQAALAIAQWQNNKAPVSKNSVGPDKWVGLNLLVQYFKERFYSNSVVMPVKFSRIALKKSDSEARQAAMKSEGAATNAQPTYDDTYQYLDALDEDERKQALKTAEDVEMEEDGEYRVRSAVVTAIASIRAQDGQTPPLSIHFLETVLESEDAEMVGNLVYSDEEALIEETFRKMKARFVHSESDDEEDDQPAPPLCFVASVLVADALLALCHVNSMPAVITDPTTGKTVQSTAAHPLSRLMKIARNWLDWELYRENIRSELARETQTGLSGNCHDTIACCAIIALSNLAISIQSTTDPENAPPQDTGSENGRLDVDASAARFYIDIFDSKPIRNDLARAACAQAIACICCAADRFEKEGVHAVGLLVAMEFLLNRINDEQTSIGLRHTLALIMMDACTGKVCSMQRVGAIAGRNDLITSMARFMNGPLGACNGGDNGSAILMSVSPGSFPAASAVNDGARRGMRLLSRAGHPKEDINNEIVVRVARFATGLWRTINGEPAEPSEGMKGGVPAIGVCAYDGILRSSLLALWQWVWPRGCYAVLQVQSWKAHEGTQRYRDMGAHHVMKITDKDKAVAAAEENSLSEINRLINNELDRQRWRGEMARKAYELYKASKGAKPITDVAAAEQGIGQPLPPIERDPAFKQGGWIASAAQQRRMVGLDGGTAVTKLRLKVKKDD